MAPPSHFDPDHYTHSPAHHAVACRNYPLLQTIISALPPLRNGDDIRTEADAIAEEQKAVALSAILDSRDVVGRETPLHLAVRLSDATSLKLLMLAGADASLQNERGWSPLHEAICSGQENLAIIILKHHQTSAWNKWCRRFPRISAAMTRMKDFSAELTFHFESSIIPFLSKVAPSDTYKIWKQGPNLRADITLAGFDGLTVQRANKSFLFFGEGRDENGIPRGSICVLDHERKKITNVLEGMGKPVSDERIAKHVAVMAKTNLYRPSLDVTEAILVPQLSWRWQPKVENVGSWKCRVYDMNNVVLSFKSRKISGALTDKEVLEMLLESSDGGNELCLDDDDDDDEDEDDREEGASSSGSQLQDGRMDIIINQKRSTSSSTSPPNHGSGSSSSSSSTSPPNHGKKEGGKRWFSNWGWKGKPSTKAPTSSSGKHMMETKAHHQQQHPKPGLTMDLPTLGSTSQNPSMHSFDHSRSKDIPSSNESVDDGKSLHGPSKEDEATTKNKASKTSSIKDLYHNQHDDEIEIRKQVRPVLWLSSDFPLSTEEVVPLLDILANKVKAVRRVRELLTMKLPQGTFPIKIALPLVATIKLVLTFTKFEELPSEECFLTPMSSPTTLDEEPQSSSWFSWTKGSTMDASQVTKLEKEEETSDLFAIPHDYVWSASEGKKSRKKREMKKVEKHQSSIV